MMPDIAHAKMLCKHLREVVGLDTNYLPAYFHAFQLAELYRATCIPSNTLVSFVSY